MQWRMAKTIGKAVGIDEPTADAATAYAVERDQLIAEGNPPHSICLTNCGCVWCGGDSYRLSRRAQHLAQPVRSLGEARDLLIIDPGELLSFDLSVERIQRCAHRRNGGRAEGVGGGREWGGGRGHATPHVGETAAGWACRNAASADSMHSDLQTIDEVAKSGDSTCPRAERATYRNVHHARPAPDACRAAPLPFAHHEPFPQLK